VQVRFDASVDATAAEMNRGIRRSNTMIYNDVGAVWFRRQDFNFRDDQIMLIDFITRHRGVFVTIFVLPLSLAFKLFMGVRNRLIFWLRSAPEQHDKKVEKVRQQVLNWQKSDPTVFMCTARPGWQAMSLKVGRYKRTDFRVHIDLSDVLQIDRERGTVRVEPMVTMGQITAALNPLGWTLAVVPELNALTVGGLINGFGIESSSHKYGLFQHICVTLEIITASGQLVRCTANENPELFFAIPWSYGSLGFLVAAELKIVPAKKSVHLRYLPFRSRQDFVKRFDEESRRPFAEAADFIEGLMFSEQEGVLMLGTFADVVDRGGTKNAINRFWKPWFYEHVRSFLTPLTQPSPPGEEGRVRGADEWIPLRHYYHRHTRALFWELKQIIPFGNHPLFRYLLGWMAPPEISLLKMTETKKLHELYDAHHMVQDLIVPLKTLEQAMAFLHTEVDLYPLWLCPCRVFPTPFRCMINPLPDEEYFVDVGLYGEPGVKPYNAAETHRKIEAFVRETMGFQALYADTYQTAEEFRVMFDHGLLDRLRQETGALKAFREPYQKVSRAARV